MKRDQLYLMVVSAMLIAIGIIIPILSPVKILLEPASFTLASHVAIFIAMFISPISAVAVSIGTTLGFLLAAYPIVIVMRAAVHIIFALSGALILRKNPTILDRTVPLILFSTLISLLHGISELLVVMPFYFGNQLTNEAWYSRGFLISVVLLVGVGTVLHSLVDFFIARGIWIPLKKLNQRLLGHRALPPAI
jgi:niacin transporter